MEKAMKNKVSLHLEKEGQLLSHLGYYNNLDDAKAQADSIGLLHEGCEVIAECEGRTYLLTDDWEELTDEYEENQPDWEQEWEDFGEVYDDEPNYI